MRFTAGSSTGSRDRAQERVIPATSRPSSKRGLPAWRSNDDEAPRADASDRELLMPLERDPLDRHLSDAGQRRSAAQEGDELVHRGRGALGMDR